MLELYHNNISVCAQKVRIVLAEKNLPWTNHHLSLAKGDQLTAEFKKMNPRGVVPVLVHEGRIIVESSVICTYLDEVFPNPPLMPTNPAERATMRLWCKLPDDILHTACATVSFAISFGQELKRQAGTGLARAQQPAMPVVGFLILELCGPGEPCVSADRAPARGARHR